MSGLVDFALEAALLGCLLLEPRRLAVVRPILPDAAAFAEPAHRAIYRALFVVVERGADPDPNTVREALIGIPDAEGVTPGLLAEVVDSVATAANAEPYARTLRDLWQRRLVVQQARVTLEAAQDRTKALRATVAETVTGLAATHQAVGRGPVSMRQGLWEVMEDLDRQAAAGDVVGLATRLPDLDRLTHGWKPGELVVIGARPSVGKTSFALDCALAAADVGPVLFVSLEMTAKQLRRRLLSREAEVNLWWIRDKESMGRYAPRLGRAASLLGQVPLRLLDHGQTPGEVRLAADQYATEAEEPLRLIVIDYLQLMRSGRRASNRNEELGDISRDLARLAIDLDVPVLALSQFSRDPAKAGRRPTMHDLRDSGAIEQDASTILILHHTEQQPEALRLLTPDTYLTELVVEKNRHGATGRLEVHHNRGIGKWSSAAAVDREEFAHA